MTLRDNSRARLQAIRFAGIALSTSAAITALTGCGSTSGVTPTPSATELAVDRPAVVERVDTIADFKEYAETPREDQLAYVDYWTEVYSQGYDFIYDGDPRYSKLNPASATNTDREIVDNLNHMVQLIEMTPENHTYTSADGVEWGATLNTDEAKKFISGVINNVDPSTGFAKRVSEGIDSRKGTPAATVGSPYFQMVNPDFTGSNFPCTDAVTQTEEVCRSIDVTEIENTGSLRVILTPYKDAITGSIEYMWLSEERG